MMHAQWGDATTHEPLQQYMVYCCSGSWGTTTTQALAVWLLLRPTLLIFGKTISGTDARIGRSRLPKPLTVAGMTKKKIINMAWARWAG